MRYLGGLVCVLALGVMPLVGCSEDGVQGNLCEGVECDDGSECTEDACDPATGTCEHVTLTASCRFDGMTGTCEDGVCCSAFEDPEGPVCVPDVVGRLEDCVCEPSRCQIDDDCDDYTDCTEDLCSGTSRCSHLAVMDGTPCDGGTCQAGECDLASLVLPCTEQGIRNAIVAGGGPYTFDCGGPKTLITEAEILIIDTSVILDGQGALTVDGNGEHALFWITGGATVELTGFGVTNSDLEGAEAIRNEGTMTLTNSTVSGNPQGIGNSGTMTLTNSTVSGSTDATREGISSGGTLTLTNSTVSGNAGRGIEISNGTLTLTNSTVSGNSGGDSGGGIGSSHSTVTLTNSTVSGNSVSSGKGSGIWIHNTKLMLTNSTVSGDIHATGVYEPHSVEMTATLIEGACTQDEDLVTWISNGYNIESPGNTCGLDQTGDQVDVTEGQLNLGPLQNNGGPTMTHALLPGSVAIDQIPEAECLDADGAPLTTDQRGEPRPETGGTMCDVGSFEVQP